AKLAIQNAAGNFIVPYVIEPSAGLDRGILAILTEGFSKEALENGSERVVLKLKPSLAPFKVAVAPLAKNNGVIVALAKNIVKKLSSSGIGRVKYEDTGNIGKAYRRHDEIGTPFCVTVDFEALDNYNVTVRDRNTMQQQRVNIDDLPSFFNGKLSS
ncbi:MAG: hypothetical protein LBD81_02730, partial [Holosporaceae bacterium]|nr:hypothetical protein [Holosporaceae bacterium]